MPSAVFILIRDGRVLMEQRPDRDDDFFPGAWLFPGGKIEFAEEPVAALLREATEELGIAIVDATPLCSEQQVYYARPNEQSHRLYPWLVTRWYGEVPERVLDSEAVLAWRSLNDALASPVECTRLMAESVVQALGTRSTCRAPKHGLTSQPAEYTITYRTPPITGSRAAPGMAISDGVCARCRDTWAGEIETAGGEVIGLHALPVSPPIEPAPVGLDAIAPSANPEPVKIRVQRKRAVTEA